MDYKLELDVCDPFLPVEQLINTRLEIACVASGIVWV